MRAGSSALARLLRTATDSTRLACRVTPAGEQAEAGCEAGRGGRGAQARRRQGRRRRPRRADVTWQRRRAVFAACHRRRATRQRAVSGVSRNSSAEPPRPSAAVAVPPRPSPPQPCRAARERAPAPGFAASPSRGASTLRRRPAGSARARRCSAVLRCVGPSAATAQDAGRRAVLQCQLRDARAQRQKSVALWALARRRCDRCVVLRCAAAPCRGERDAAELDARQQRGSAGGLQRRLARCAPAP